MKNTIPIKSKSGKSIDEIYLCEYSSLSLTGLIWKQIHLLASYYLVAYELLLYALVSLVQQTKINNYQYSMLKYVTLIK